MKDLAFSAAQSLWRRIGPYGTEVSRRAALARAPAPEGVTAPPLRLLWSEIRSLRALGRESPPEVRARRPRPVMLLPGFGAHPRRMRPMRDALDAAGHHAEEWGLGYNLGPTPENFAYLLRRLVRIERAYGAKVALVGWSLGGLFARELARREPDRVACVITMGTPFSGDMRGNNGWRAYQLVTGYPVDAPPVACEFAVKPPVPTVALWSPRDGVVHPRSAAGWPGERDRAVALRCTHMGFAGCREATEEVLRQLDRVD